MDDSDWLDKDQLQERVIEELKDTQYEEFVAIMDRLLQHPYSYKCKEFIMQNRRNLVINQRGREIIEPKIDEDGRKYVTTCGKNKMNRFLSKLLNPFVKNLVFSIFILECRFKSAIANVTVISPGNFKSYETIIIQ